MDWKRKRFIEALPDVGEGEESEYVDDGWWWEAAVR